MPGNDIMMAITRKKQTSTGKCGIQGAGPGRPKGRKNTISQQIVKDVFLVAAGKDGTECPKYLADLKKKYPKVFARMVEKLMPAKIEADVEHKVSWAELVANAPKSE